MFYFFFNKTLFFLSLDFSTSLKQQENKIIYKKAKTNDIALIMVRIYLFGKYIRYFHRIVMSLRTDMAREINCYGQFGGLYYQNHNVNSISIVKQQNVK